MLLSPANLQNSYFGKNKVKVEVLLKLSSIFIMLKYAQFADITMLITLLSKRTNTFWTAVYKIESHDDLYCTFRFHLPDKDLCIRSARGRPSFYSKMYLFVLQEFDSLSQLNG